MEARKKLGATLATLRRLSGLSVEEAAAHAQLTSAELLQAEAGKVSRHAHERLSLFFGLDPDAFAEGIAAPAESKPSQATVFLLHGAYQDFDSSDWAVLERAMESARLFSAKSETGRKGLALRLNFLPTPPAGPEPRDAAQQGHKLARQVRRQMQLEGAPIDDIRALLEERLGIVVLVEDLSTIDLRAASILDVDRTSAAAVLSAKDEARLWNPLLNRVYLAHELCHLLFDPGAPGCVQIALDDRPQGYSKASLLESRARGFAAEFLIPSQGLDALLGRRQVPEREVGAARAMITSVAESFKTPREIATRHLQNLRFIEDAIVGELLHDPPPRPAPASATTLPDKGQPPLCLKQLPRAPTTVHGPGSRPAFVPESRKVATEQLQTFADDILKAAYGKQEENKPREATDFLVEKLDALLMGNELNRVRMLLEQLDAHRLPPSALTGVLTLTRHAKQELAEEHLRFFERAMKALETTWSFSEERRNRIAERLR